ncbi:hypothetical protein BLNAU_3349 [Blattamonas nauphoetae]|uniref:Uncharacterized protein n=1 Tax=Blattamonas nauphoetae TaxID=2049346 RepID=A0ABQ9YD18_9EUKA|nr:hypothetical protein BLNAU_3349 [Blattamonas nauphoetae]
MLSLLVLISHVSGFVFKGKKYDVEGLMKSATDQYYVTYLDDSIIFNFMEVVNLTLYGTCTQMDEKTMAVVMREGMEDMECINAAILDKPVFEATQSPLGISITYKSKTEKTFTFQVDCAEMASTFIATRDASDNYRLSIQHPGGCGVRASSDIFGIIFFSVLLGAIVLYFAIGIPICACGMKKKGIEVIPGGKFWRSVPGLFVDGIKCMFCCRKKEIYDPVE